MLTVTPKVALSDEPISVCFRGLTPKSRVRFTLTTTDFFKQKWSAQAVLSADPQGEVDFAKQSHDVMSLICAMQPAGQSDHKTAYIPADERGIDIQIEAKSESEAKQVTVQRLFLSPEVTVRNVSEGNVLGRYFVPKGSSSLPAILLVSGSDGGIASQLSMAALLASHGYAVFLMAYFNYEGLSKTLYDLPLNTFLSGVEWLRQQPEVNGDRIAAMGPSKGAEGLLAAASYLPAMNLSALVAISPSSVIWQGMGGGRPKEQSSWSLDQQSMPYLSMAGEKVVPQFLRADFIRRFHLQRVFPKCLRMNLAAAYSNVKKSSTQLTKASIPVENIKAPLCIVAGGQDKLWPSEFMARMIQDRRTGCAHAEQDSFLFYEKAGHQFRIPNLPTSITWRAPKNGGMIINFGGEPDAIALAQRDAWENILLFFRRHLLNS